ncbi:MULTISPECIES: NnrS family protein [Myxococcaceae]|uniref:NnrS family protein n=1 Tax=Myxococcaceae TaxID=31 RepID=UPI00188F8C8A|nr:MULTISPECIES: NnrS family protein [Myxococcaceae]MBF5045728.1 NnrS family protein [Simulacricoccus sp. 17bor-14]
MTTTFLSAPTWRREPYRLLFPLGALLGVAGVLPWLLFGLGASLRYDPVFHALALVQGFLASYVLGFLFTFVPRRTATRAPAAWQMGLALLLPVALTGAAWMGQLALSQALWVLLLLMLVGFVGARALRPQKQVPGGFAWLPVSLVMGLVGSLLTAAPAELLPMGHLMGQGLLTQGMLTGLVLGVGTLLLPVLLYARPPANPGDHLLGVTGLLHLGAALLFIASFWLEAARSTQLGYALRAAVCAGLLVGPMGLWRAPTERGLHRRFVWLSAWLLPVGYALVALFPAHRVAGEHVVFIGGLALITLSISTHVVLAHGGYGGLLRASPWHVAGCGALSLSALLLRGLVSLDPAHFRGWLAGAAACFLGALALWAALVVPRLRSAPPRAEAG